MRTGSRPGRGGVQVADRSADPRPASTPSLRDARLALPLALVLLLVLSTSTVLTYRNGVRQLIAQRQEEALSAAARAARSLAAAPRVAPDPLAFHSASVRLVVADGSGQPLRAAGEPLVEPFLAPLAGRPPGEPRAVGPDEGLPGLVAAFHPAGNGQRIVRLDLAAGALDGQRRTAAVLTWVGSAISAAVLLWLLLFVRQLLRPYEALLARARELQGSAAAGEAGGDDAALLLATVERALAAPAAGREELAVLERTLAPSLESGLLLLDREGGVLALNPAGAGLLGPAPPPRTPLAELLAGQPELLAVLERSLATGQGVQRHECEVRAPGGGSARIGLTVTPLRRGGHERLGFLVLFAALGGDDGGHERLAESLAQLGELSAGVAHELRNGLATLRGYLTLLERDPHGTGAAECIAELRQETEHLQRVVSDFLSFARPETARLEPVDLVRLVRHAAADPALHAGLAVSEAATELDPATLTGDSHLLVRALRNLFRNALEAQASAGVETPVRVEAGWEPQGFVIAVADRGPGLPAEVRRRLFQPFAAGRPGGVGLGLALAHRIVTLHGGRLTVEDAPGGGTVARVSFPRERFAPTRG
jgi:signal transduction histidine kinase